ncbi:MAG: CoA transferase [Myxococcota bacterium]|nr:CoA transferase [Myxococcota bacterium]
MAQETQKTAPGPCAGIRVLDFSTVISGPICTQALGDLGADVVKVEPPTGDPCRHSGAPFREPGFSGFLSQFNRNKRSIVLDLAQEEARSVAARLAEHADVLVENFRPGVAQRLGIGWEALSARNPRLVYVSINGFGPDGPYAALPAYDHVIQALGGMMPTQGGNDPPRLVLSSVADKSSGLIALSGILAALLVRERDGRGQQVQVPMLDAFASFNLPDAMMSRSYPDLTTDAPGAGDVFRTFETADGHVVGIVLRDSQFQGICETLGLDALARDERFSSMASRFVHYREFAELLAAEFHKWPTRKLIDRAREHGVPFAPVCDVEEFLADPQVAHNETAPEVEDSRFGALTRYLRHPVRYGRTPATLRRHAPRMGEHTDEILGEIGLEAEEIDGLRRSGAARGRGPAVSPRPPPLHRR